MTTLIIKVFSGSLSDYLGWRKGLAALGDALGDTPQSGTASC